MTDRSEPRLDLAAGQRTALITGASSGIGLALAREYASRDCNLVLVARRRERLEELARELKDTHGHQCVVAPADLADPDTPRALEQAVAARGLTIDVLVNNAGFGVPGTFLSQDWKVHQDSLQVMVTAIAELSYRFLPGMVERGYGRIVNIASLAGHMPGTAGHTLYGPVKAWLVRFSEALSFEYGERGVKATAVCPGFTYSEFHDVTGTRDLVSEMPKYMWMSAEEVAEQAVDASDRGEIVHINGRVNRSIALLGRLLPRPWLYRMMAKRSRRFRKLD